jgi:hypothetical protein
MRSPCQLTTETGYFWPPCVPIVLFTRGWKRIRFSKRYVLFGILDTDAESRAFINITCNVRVKLWTVEIDITIDSIERGTQTIIFKIDCSVGNGVTVYSHLKCVTHSVYLWIRSVHLSHGMTESTQQIPMGRGKKIQIDDTEILQPCNNYPDNEMTTLSSIF